MHTYRFRIADQLLLKIARFLAALSLQQFYKSKQSNFFYFHFLLHHNQASKATMDPTEDPFTGTLTLLANLAQNTIKITNSKMAVFNTSYVLFRHVSKG